MLSKKYCVFIPFFIKGIILIGLLIHSVHLFSQERDLPSVFWNDGQLIRNPDSLGNEIPDYSHCGYRSSNEAIPYVPVRVVVPSTGGDATSLIRNAIDYLASLPADENGFRGAMLLKEGNYTVSGRMTISSGGIVIRGSGRSTVLRAGGINRDPLLTCKGKDDRVLGDPIRIANVYVPVNSHTIRVENTDSFEPGNRVYIHRPSTQEWIQEVDMEEFGGESGWLGWKPGERDIYWDRKIEKIEGDQLFLDAPITSSLDSVYGGGYVIPYTWEGRISHVGIENLILESDVDSSHLRDEDHCWFGITFENITDAWVRQVEFRHFAGSAVAVYESAGRVTVEDCISRDPVSEIGGQRRHTFFTMGQQTLFQRCYAEGGYHDFATGFMAAGPNAFVQCESHLPHSFSGSIDSWASGVLFDRVTVDGHALCFSNRGQDGQGAGWTAAHSMFWQCSAARIECFQPPTAQNYAYGAWAQFAGDGLWYEANSHIKPPSLFYAQLAQRQGTNPSEYEEQIMPCSEESTSSPTIDQAVALSKKALNPPVLLKDYIAGAALRNPIPVDPGNAVLAVEVPVKRKVPRAPVIPLSIRNGWLVRQEKIVTGDRMNVPWWRGDARPFEAKKAVPAITRFVPGRTGNGYTDDLRKVVTYMEEKNILAVDHNYGLWYDRRRDDHERVRRMNGDVWPPFYEQPFARSGIGLAWDGLSKYDLFRYNPWYWNRLARFVLLAEEKGKILIHQNYFQHNILEAGAHWADFPWRPANNINRTGFPEPPPYAGDKRIYMAEQFYDITHPVRREIHRMYIRQCLDNFRGRSNVIQSISAEYTGPLHFMEFWLDVIAEWEQETGNHVLVSLSATKDVQDAILQDPVRAEGVDIIDIRYWAYRADGSLYAPPGDKQLAPRQHARKTDPGKRSFEQIYRAVREYRDQYPGKAVIFSEGNYTHFGWAVFMAGGSMPSIQAKLPDKFLKAATGMKPVNRKNPGKEVYTLENKGQSMILYSRSNKTIELDLSLYTGEFRLVYMDPLTGMQMRETTEMRGGTKQKIELPSGKDVVLWIAEKYE
jgi:hypothetical protein